MRIFIKQTTAEEEGKKELQIVDSIHTFKLYKWNGNKKKLATIKTTKRHANLARQMAEIHRSTRSKL